jgi:hypothetical protein
MMIHMSSWMKNKIQKKDDIDVEVDEVCNYIF